MSRCGPEPHPLLSAMLGWLQSWFHVVSSHSGVHQLPPSPLRLLWLTFGPGGLLGYYPHCGHSSGWLSGGHQCSRLPWKQTAPILMAVRVLLRNLGRKLRGRSLSFWAAPGLVPALLPLAASCLVLCGDPKCCQGWQPLGRGLESWAQSPAPPCPLPPFVSQHSEHPGVGSLCSVARALLNLRA